MPYTEYSIRVQAVNENGPGAFSKDIVIRTHSTQPTQPPHNVTLEAASSTVHYSNILFKKWLTESKENFVPTLNFFVCFSSEYYCKMGAST